MSKLIIDFLNNWNEALELATGSRLLALVVLFSPLTWIVSIPALIVVGCVVLYDSIRTFVMETKLVLVKIQKMPVKDLRELKGRGRNRFNKSDKPSFMWYYAYGKATHTLAKRARDTADDRSSNRDD